MTLLDAGSNPNYPDHGGFPAIIAALSTDRTDRLEIAQVLVNGGADPDMRGVNDWTPLPYAVAIRSVDAIRLLLAVGADPALETRIDDYTTALKEADNAGFEDGASLLRDAMAGRGSDGQ
ncbi:ankyrin repeat domain-containing protein [Mesorhizobium sp. M0029]|uniref:ankyrin repeat domain-containing protein n=1 Tax=Mesorhizobium sp. M0029 TaxID=2956850 RepID=UPI00333A46C8